VKAIAKQFDGKAAFTPMGKKPYPLRLVKKRGGGLRPQPSFLTGFTIIELLTVMSVIIILISLLVPGMPSGRAIPTRMRKMACVVQRGLPRQW